MNVLGLNAYHPDGSACLVRDGEVVAAAEEERFRRVKHWAGLPSRAAAYCLEEGGIDLARVDVLALNRDPTANIVRKGWYTLRNRPAPGLVVDRLRNFGRVASVADRLSAELPGDGAFGGEVRRVEHHEAHLASTYLFSPYEEAAVASVDAFGDFASAAWGVGSGTDFGIDGRVYYPHSLGIFYQALTQYLGFPHYGDEYKVMGLAPYGRPTRLEELREVVRVQRDGTYRLALDFFRHHSEDTRYTWEGGAPTVDRLFSQELEELLGPARTPSEELTQEHRDVARSVQEMFEEAIFAFLGALHENTGQPELALSGGVAMNSVANGKVTEHTPFESVYVPPAPGDAGGAIGAAILAWGRSAGRSERPPEMIHSYWGQGFSASDYRRTLDAEGERMSEAGCRLERAATEGALCARVADAVAEGRVVGWFQGRMEFGPRALGNRSILCDPRRRDMRDVINSKIKLRESFRPFAPSILRSAMEDWFIVEDDVPFMMKVYEVRKDRRNRIPAVTHEDGTGRPHTVTPESNPLYHRLIAAFEERTGVPLVLNTSFNENEPIVHRPEEAVDCFLRTEMDLLVLGRHLIAKPE